MTATNHSASVETAAPRKNRRWVGIAQVLISIAILAWLLSRVGLQNVLSELSTLHPVTYALAGLVLLASLAVRAFRWWILLRPLGVKTSPVSLFWLYLIGFFWNSFLPSGFGGDVVKAIELRRLSGNGTAAAISIIAERMEGLFATCLTGLIVIVLWPNLVPPQAAWIVGGMCVAIMLGTWFVRLDFLQWIGKRLPLVRPVVGHKKIAGLHNALKAYTLRDLSIGLIASIPFTLLSILDNYLVGVALGIKLGIGYYAIYTPIITIINLLPLSFNGVGIREYTYQVLFGLVGISADQAIAMALAFNILRFGVGIIGGVVSLVSGFQHLKSPQPSIETEPTIISTENV